TGLRRRAGAEQRPCLHPVRGLRGRPLSLPRSLRGVSRAGEPARPLSHAGAVRRLLAGRTIPGRAGTGAAAGPSQPLLAEVAGSTTDEPCFPARAPPLRRRSSRPIRPRSKGDRLGSLQRAARQRLERGARPRCLRLGTTRRSVAATDLVLVRSAAF